MLDSEDLFSTYAVTPEDFVLYIDFVLSTIHREENIDQLEGLVSVFERGGRVSETIPVVMLIYLRIRKIHGVRVLDIDSLALIDPIAYFDMLWLLKKYSLVVTDSGVVQKLL